MATTALYQWSVAGSPVSILIDLPLVDRLRVAATTPVEEMGGLLLGHFDGAYSVITDFEEVESEHKRGPAYTLSNRDEARLGSRMEGRRKKTQEVVGFFRSHRRPGMYLDEGDNQVLSSRFNNPNQVALLIRPMSDGSATGGFFFWEEGNINRKQTYLQFPMSSAELEAGDFPLVEPVVRGETVIPATPVSSFDEAETIEALPRATAWEAPEPEHPTLVNARVAPPMEPEREKTPRRLSGPLIGLIAAGAAIAGYLIGTSGSHRDRFGARAGDIAFNTAPEPAAPPPASQPAPSSPSAAPSSTSSQPATPPSGQLPTSIEKSPATQPLRPEEQRRSPMPVATPPLPAAVTKGPPPPARGPAETSPPSVPEQPTSAASEAPPSSSTPENWQHFHPQQPSNSQVAAANPVPQPSVPRPGAGVPPTESTVYLETVESGGVSRAMGKIPLVGVFHHPRGGDKFVPAQALHSFAPKVPNNLARELTGTLPVDLKLKVDETGKVSSVEILSHQTAEEFVRLAGDAAYDWRFEPARLKDKPVSSDVIAHFRFRPVL